MARNAAPLGAVELANLYAQIRSGAAQRTRESAGLSQSDVARTIGVKRSTVSSWESGRRRPRDESAARYAELLRALRAALAAKADEAS